MLFFDIQKQYRIPVKYKKIYLKEIKQNGN